MAKYLGARQIAECPRCGNKVAASALRRDGRIPSLFVCGDCYDPAHEGEKPFVPRNNEGRPRWPVAPERLPPPVASTLTFGSNALTWAQFTSNADMIVRYEVWESVDLAPQEVPAVAPNVLVATLSSALNLNTGVVAYGSPYTYVPASRVPVTPGTYYLRTLVRGYTALGASVDTNIVEQTVVVS